MKDYIVQSGINLKGILASVTQKCLYILYTTAFYLRIKLIRKMRSISCRQAEAVDF